MRKLMIFAAALTAAVVPATAASAQSYGGGYGYGYGNGGYGRHHGGYNNRYGYGRGNRVQREIRECRRELRHADSRWEYERELRECRREIEAARRGYGNGYGYRGDYGRRGW